MSESPTNPARLFVGNVPYTYTEGQLLALFVPFGRIVSLAILRDKKNHSRGYGYVEFDNSLSAANAKQELHQSIVEGLRLIVDFAKPDPFDTPEGQARHEEALRLRPRPAPRVYRPKPKSSSKPSTRPHSSRSGGPHIRQSVWDSRHHHSRTGAKFARRTKTAK